MKMKQSTIRVQDSLDEAKIQSSILRSLVKAVYVACSKEDYDISIYVEAIRGLVCLAEKLDNDLQELVDELANAEITWDDVM